MDKNLIFSINKKDLKIEYYRGSGKGGQKRNKTSSAVRITHPASGATAKCEDQRSQTQNERIALKRLVNNDRFKQWVRVQAAMLEQGYRDLEHKVEEMMDEKNLKIEYLD